jgi:regulator of RNase E activity RraB
LVRDAEAFDVGVEVGSAEGAAQDEGDQILQVVVVAAVAPGIGEVDEVCQKVQVAVAHLQSPPLRAVELGDFQHPL